MRKNISSMNPIFYHCVVFFRRVQRRLHFFLHRHQYAKTRTIEKLPYRVKKHQSVLIRVLGETETRLQENKVVNLKLAVEKINGIILKPGEVFSFYYLVGHPMKGNGYKEGMMLSNGKAIAGVGGGLCQIANLMNWVVMHSDLDITERHHHSFDPFPDSGRVVPFGCGASLFYNYVDFQITNNTQETYQFLFWFDAKCINCDLRINKEPLYKYSIKEENHRFEKVEDTYFRCNEIWRIQTRKKGGAEIGRALMMKNRSKVLYNPKL